MGRAARGHATHGKQRPAAADPPAQPHWGGGTAQDDQCRRCENASHGKNIFGLFVLKSKITLLNC